jgi:hypothetical protein
MVNIDNTNDDGGGGETMVPWISMLMEQDHWMEIVSIASATVHI